MRLVALGLGLTIMIREFDLSVGLVERRLPDGTPGGINGVREYASDLFDETTVEVIGRRFILRGAAWAGENRVRQVDVSVDGGKSWQTARLAGEPRTYTWVRWSHEWKIPCPGPYELAVRAIDDQGREQPAERSSNRVDDYEWNQIQLIRVTVT